MARRAEQRLTTDAASEAVSPSAGRAEATDAAAWIARIVELRRVGRDDEADAEVKKFRAQHPALTLPDEALRRGDSK